MYPPPVVFGLSNAAAGGGGVVVLNVPGTVRRMSVLGCFLFVFGVYGSYFCCFFLLLLYRQRWTGASLTALASWSSPDAGTGPMAPSTPRVARSTASPWKGLTLTQAGRTSRCDLLGVGRGGWGELCRYLAVSAYRFRVASVVNVLLSFLKLFTFLSCCYCCVLVFLGYILPLLLHRAGLRPSGGPGALQRRLLPPRPPVG